MLARLFQNDNDTGTERAYKFLRPENQEVIWVPKSVVNHISRDRPDINGMRACTVDVMDWFAEKENL